MTQIFWVGLSAEHVLGRMCRFKASQVRKRNSVWQRGKASGEDSARRTATSFGKRDAWQTVRSSKPVIRPNPNPKNLWNL
jgi:hypothetical protein